MCVCVDILQRTPSTLTYSTYYYNYPSKAEENVSVKRYKTKSETIRKAVYAVLVCFLFWSNCWDEGESVISPHFIWVCVSRRQVIVCILQKLQYKSMDSNKKMARTTISLGFGGWKCLLAFLGACTAIKPMWVRKGQKERPGDDEPLTKPSPSSYEVSLFNNVNRAGKFNTGVSCKQPAPRDTASVRSLNSSGV